MSDQDDLRAQMPEGMNQAMRQVAWKARHMSLQSGGRFSADDLAQEGFKALVEASHRWDCHKGVPFEAYGMIRARGAMIDYVRKQTGWRRGWRHGLELVSLADIPEADLYHEGPEQHVIDKLAGEEILGEIEGLPPREAGILKARAAGKKLREIAAAEGIGITRTAELIWRARHHLRARLDAKGVTR